MKRRAVIEDAIGEKRAAIYEGRRLVELRVDRVSQAHLPKLGEVWTARVTSVEPSVAGAFIDLGIGPAGILKFSAQRELPKLIEGAYLDVMILRESIAEKGPNLRYAGEPSAEKSGPVSRLDFEAQITADYPDIVIESAAINVIDEVTERRIAIQGGGAITIEQTQALLAIDVDKGAATSPIDMADAATRLIAQQIRLRGLGGLIVIDFPNMRQPRQRTRLQKSLERAFETDMAIVKFAPISRFGCLEMTRSQARPSLDAVLNTRFGEPSVETQALRALRRLTREGAVSAGAQLELTVTPEIDAWLKTAKIDWKSELDDRLGARYTIKTGQSVEVKADR